MLHITADSRYVLFVNGEQVGRGPVRSWPKEQFYDSYDIGGQLRPGVRNTIAVLVLHFGVSNFYYLRGRGGLIAEIEADGRTLAATDAAWRTERLGGQRSNSPRMACQQGFGGSHRRARAGGRLGPSGVRRRRLGASPIDRTSRHGALDLARSARYSFFDGRKAVSRLDPVA
ncbi:hypothetical protein [Cohnella rhizosphaerae]|uniref:Bacterial alpha-L-rhamnosidase N-terminal domain-containing protein n=1 Tax=Cohnella rhizosphaerae TaxID=1457232 RepID=A0A9X4L5D6_9BACL|nr:hypothetical protein [Cohnella rhizosphaerae]MDG0814179.1 hypothetical protein [Cohnella rhizosphaerae]